MYYNCSFVGKTVLLFEIQCLCEFTVVSYFPKFKGYYMIDHIRYARGGSKIFKKRGLVHGDGMCLVEPISQGRGGGMA